MGATGVRAGRKRDGRGKAAAGISLGVHLAIGALAGTVLHGPSTLLADVGNGDPIAVNVDIEERAFDLDEPVLNRNDPSAPVAPPVAPKTPALAAAPRVRAPRPHPTSPVPPRPPAAPAITTSGTTPIVADDEDQVDPVTTPAPAQIAASLPASVTQGTTSALVATAPSSVRPGSAAVTDSARPARSTPVFLTADVASYLRSQDDFPALPASLRRQGARYQAKLEICVAADGRVTDVGFRSREAAALDSVLQAAVRGWRYRPFVVDGVPTPFCHNLIVSYEIG